MIAALFLRSNFENTVESLAFRNSKTLITMIQISSEESLKRYQLRLLLVYAKKEVISVVVLSRVKQMNNLVESVARENGDRRKTFLSVTLKN